MMVLVSSAIAMAEEANENALFQWPGFTNNPSMLIKKFQCGRSIHDVYACLRKSFMKLHTNKFSLLHPAGDCCTTIGDFRDRCTGFGIGKLEAFIFPPLLFKQCNAGDASEPASAPAAAGPAADADVEV